MVAPERIDLVPMSSAAYPKVAFPPPIVHMDRIKLRRVVLDICVVTDRSRTVLMDGPLLGRYGGYVGRWTRVA